MLRRPTLAHALTALLALAAGSLSAQYSTPMRDVENPDRSPFMANAAREFRVSATDLPFPTPAGRRYFIDYVAMECTTSNPADTFTLVRLNGLQNTPGGATVIAMPAIAMERRGPSPFGGAVWSGAANVRMFSDPELTSGGGNAISMRIIHTDATSLAACQGYVHGHTLAP